MPIKKILKSVTCPCCETKGQVRRDFDFPKTMRVCTGCGSDFNTSGDITFNAVLDRENFLLDIRTNNLFN